MNKYIRERLRTDAQAVIAAAQNEERVQHLGLRGRFRELLVEGLLRPWLPAYAVPGTGIIVDWEEQARQSTQEDLVIFDPMVMPHLRHSVSGSEGVFPVDGVLLRIEVKSTLTRGELRDAVRAAGEIYKLRFGNENKYVGWGAATALFAYGSDLVRDPEDDFKRLIEVVKEEGFYYSGSTPEIPGPISALCVAGRGCWTFGGMPSRWQRAKMQDPHDEILHFVGVLSNSCFAAHILRLGGRLDRGAAGGIGRYIISNETYESDDNDPPRSVPSREAHRLAPGWQTLMQEAISAKAAALHCPGCGQSAFRPSETMFSPVEVTEVGRVDEYGQIIPLVHAMCANCGLVLWSSAKHLGLVWTMPA